MRMSVSGTLLRFVNYQKTMSFEADTVGQAIAKLAERCPDVRPVLYDANGNVRQVHRIFLNGEQIEPGQMGKPLSSHDQLDILTAVAGG